MLKRNLRKNEFPWQSWTPVEEPNVRYRYDYCPIGGELNINISKPRGHKLKGRITGWCSWCVFGRDITHEILIDQAKNIKRLKLDMEYILIDGGWCCIGDWCEGDKSKFPKGIKSTIDEIKSMGFKVGLWMSPFQLSHKSEFARNNKSLIVREGGRFVEGLNLTVFDRYLPWSRLLLDFNSKEARDYIYNSIRRIVEEWKIDLVKLDFLYANYWNPFFDSRYEPALQLRQLFRFIKEEFSEVYLMACGCPFEPAKYLVDSIRIGKDATIPYAYGIPIVNELLNSYGVKVLKNKYKFLKERGYDKFYNFDFDAFVSNPVASLSDDDLMCFREMVLNSKVVFSGDKIKLN